MPLTNTDIDNYCRNFYGYGKWSYPFWILGLEEAVGHNIANLNDVIDVKANRFSTSHFNRNELIDNHTFQSGIIDNVYGLLDNFLNPSLPGFKLQRYWKRALQLIYSFQHGLIPIEHISIPTDIQPVVANRLGRNVPGLHLLNGISLIELFPLALPSHNESMFNFFYKAPQLGHHFTNNGIIENWNTYNEFVFEERKRWIINQLGNFQPSLVLMMGINDYEIFSDGLSHLNPNFANFDANRRRFEKGIINWPSGNRTIIAKCCQPNGAWSNAYWNQIINHLTV